MKGGNKMENNYVVYKHTAPNGKVYIGITRRKPEVRWGCNGSRYYNNKHFFSAIQKYGWDNIKHEILYDRLDAHTAEEHEKRLIFLYHSDDRKYGYNNTLGGEHGKMADHVNEENRRRGKMLIGAKNPFYGRKHTDNSKALMRAARLNNPNRFKQSSIAGKVAKAVLGKEVSKYTKDGKYIATYSCLADAAESIGKRSGSNHIGAVCSGIRK